VKGTPLKVEDFLAPGEKVLIQDGVNSFTDRRLLIVGSSKVTAVPYEQISSAEYSRRVPLTLIILGALVLVAGFFLWLAPPGIPRVAGTDSNLFLILVLVFAIVLIGMGLALVRRTLVIRTTSGEAYYLRIRDEKMLNEFLQSYGRPFS
jgi:hypothetical protein